MKSNDLPPGFTPDLIASLERLRVAGIIEDYSFGPGPDAGWVQLTPAAARLLALGRLPLDPEFLRVFASGRPDAVRGWLDSLTETSADE